LNVSWWEETNVTVQKSDFMAIRIGKDFVEPPFGGCSYRKEESREFWLMRFVQKSGKETIRRITENTIGL